MAADPPGAENPPTLPPAARILWQGMISATGFFAMAWPTSRAASGPAPSSLAEVEPEAGKIHPLAFEITLCSGDCFGHLQRGRVRFCTGHPAQQNLFGRCDAFCRQLETRDARVVPGDPAKTARGFENEITMYCLAHCIDRAFSPALELVSLGANSTGFLLCNLAG